MSALMANYEKDRIAFCKLLMFLFCTQNFIVNSLLTKHKFVSFVYLRILLNTNYTA